jgi:hypothetical protein
MSTFHERKAIRAEHFQRFVFGWRLTRCTACNGSGFYDHCIRGRTGSRGDSMTDQQRAFLRQIIEARAEAARLRELMGPASRVAVLRWPSLKETR